MKNSRTLTGQTEILVELPAVSSRESFRYTANHVTHSIDDGGLVHAAIESDRTGEGGPKDLWWREYLRGRAPTSSHERTGSLRYVDLFSGPGGLALGLRQLSREVGARLVCEGAVDQDEEAMLVYAANHGARLRSTKSVSSILDFSVTGTADAARFRYQPEVVDEGFASMAGRLDIVLAGPPCQGHSNLNNISRRDDRRNALYLTVPAFSIALGVPVVVIENVPAILNDSTEVVPTAQRLLEEAGYVVTTAILSAGMMGWPQNRKRHFLVARRDRSPIPLPEVARMLQDQEQRSLWWAIGDLEEREPIDLMDQASELSDENQRRIDWLFENNEYDLALAERPDSHKGGTTYMAVYGRLRRDQPAPTITTGFMTPGRGRYVHPTKRRALTAREAARLQGFPDTYRFIVNPDRPPTRAKLAKWIGDAVPMPLGYAAALSALGAGLPE